MTAPQQAVIAKRMGKTRGALYQALRSAGRLDLLRVAS